MILLKKICIPVITLMMSTGLVMAAEVNLGIDKAVPKVGDLVNVSIDLAGFPTTHGGGINLNYNKSVLRATGVQINPVWDFVNKNGMINNANGSVSDIVFTNFNGLEGNIPAIVVQMEVIGAGAANLVASESAQNPFAGTNGALPTTINNYLAALYVQGETDPDSESTNVAEDTAQTAETLAADTSSNTENTSTVTGDTQAESSADTIDVSTAFTTGSFNTSGSARPITQQAVTSESIDVASGQNVSGSMANQAYDYGATGNGGASSTNPADQQSEGYGSLGESVFASNVATAATTASPGNNDTGIAAADTELVSQSGSKSTGFMAIIIGIVLVLIVGGYAFYRKSVAR